MAEMAVVAFSCERFFQRTFRWNIKPCNIYKHRTNKWEISCFLLFGPPETKEVRTSVRGSPKFGLFPVLISD
jgi:hypothetical protein